METPYSILLLVIVPLYSVAKIYHQYGLRRLASTRLDLSADQIHFRRGWEFATPI